MYPKKLAFPEVQIRLSAKNPSVKNGLISNSSEANAYLEYGISLAKGKRFNPSAFVRYSVLIGLVKNLRSDGWKYQASALNKWIDLFVRDHRKELRTDYLEVL